MLFQCALTFDSFSLIGIAGVSGETEGSERCEETLDCEAEARTRCLSLSQLIFGETKEKTADSIESKTKERDTDSK